ncbi:hypothetical protein [Listeria kieliensis]|uniref:DUF4364 domain-containing protein n=1 Tax=Listeria kieliensis TaxID=1621700 RepID=A0A3D8TR06_9LIST|nr:hypothetical protein [Listeria kieliensis]RDX01230.1 hypothetical protein UR08_09860 [Listeria kieliensis]
MINDPKLCAYQLLMYFTKSRKLTLSSEQLPGHLQLFTHKAIFEILTALLEYGFVFKVYSSKGSTVSYYLTHRGERLVGNIK